MRLLPILVGAACLPVVCFAADRRPTLAEVLGRGATLEEGGDHARARDAYLDGLRQFPRSGEIHFRLGTLFLRASAWAEAIEYLESARALRPRHVDTLYYVAQAYYLDGQHEPARKTLLRAITLAPTRADVAQKYGEYMCEGNLCKEGLGYLLKARRLDPTLPDIDFDLGMAYHKQAALPEARRYLETALVKDPGNLVAARFLADVLGREDQWEKARALYQSVVARDRRDAWALYGLGRALMSQGQHEAALAPLREALEADPTIAEAHFQLGQALRQLGRPDESKRELDLFKAFRGRIQSTSPALRSDRSPFEDRIWAACMRLLGEGKEAEALAYLDSLPAAERPDSSYLLGVLYFSLERHSDAVRLLAVAAAHSPMDADVLAFLGRAHVTQGDYGRAEETLARARALAPGGELPLVASGELAYARENWAEAARYLEQSKTTQVPALLKLYRSHLLTHDRAKALETAELVRAFARGDAAALRELEALLAADGDPAPASPPGP